MTQGNLQEPDQLSIEPEGLRWPAILPHAGSTAADVLHAVIRMSPLAMVLTDPNTPDFPIVFCNDAFVRLTGYTWEEAIGRNCRFLQGPETDPSMVTALREAIRVGGEIQVDLLNYRKDGSRFWNSMFVGPVKDANGKLMYYFGSQVDASARREAEEATNRERRMDTLGSLAAGLAHEINNLMTVVVGNAEMLRKVVVEDKLVERLGRIEWAARTTGTLTRQMLSFAGRHGLLAETVDLNDVLRELDGLLGNAASSSSPLTLTLCATPLLTSVDVGQLELALINLVKNAADASPPGGAIIIESARCEEAGIALAEIAVIDLGSGMSAEVAAKAMDPFFTTKEHGKGTGLGLSMVAGFCRESGGNMTLQSEVGRGTTIRLVFPLVSPAVPNPPSAAT